MDVRLNFWMKLVLKLKYERCYYFATICMNVLITNKKRIVITFNARLQYVGIGWNIEILRSLLNY